MDSGLSALRLQVIVARYLSEPVWQGDIIRLRGFTTEDWIYLAKFEESSEDARAVYRVTPTRSPEALTRHFNEKAEKPIDEDTFGLAIESLTCGEIVGAISTTEIDRRAGRFEYGLAVDRDHRRRGYAREAIILLLGYMFGERRFHKCEVRIYAFNEASLSLHARLGFREEGRLRDHEFFAGTHHDVVIMGITESEYWHLVS